MESNEFQRTTNVQRIFPKGLAEASNGKKRLHSRRRAQRKAQVRMGDESVSRTLRTFEHQRNVGCVAPVYRHIRGKGSMATKQICPSIKYSNRTTHSSKRSYPLILELPVHFTTRYAISRLLIARLWNKLPAVFFPALSDISIFKLNVEKRHSLPSPLSSCNPS